MTGFHSYQAIELVEYRDSPAKSIQSQGVLKQLCVRAHSCNSRFMLSLSVHACSGLIDKPFISKSSVMRCILWTYITWHLKCTAPFPPDPAQRLQWFKGDTTERRIMASTIGLERIERDDMSRHLLSLTGSTVLAKCALVSVTLIGMINLVQLRHHLMNLFSLSSSCQHPETWGDTVLKCTALLNLFTAFELSLMSYRIMVLSRWNQFVISKCEYILASGSALFRGQLVFYFATPVA